MQSLSYYTAGRHSRPQELQLHPLSPTKIESELLKIRAFDPHHADLDLVRRWLRQCDTYYGDACRSPATGVGSTTTDLILINHLHLGCLVESSIDVEHVTLSYVWGQVKTMKTTAANRSMLEELGSVFPNTTKFKIPTTIREAMRLATSLQQRYLWLDSLCIVQDDLASKNRYVNAMAAIYEENVCAQWNRLHCS
jgi:hypothetical protein